jgi:S1-C subfamily serine protease
MKIRAITGFFLTLLAAAPSADAVCELSATEIFQKAAPAVVYISTVGIDPYRSQDRFSVSIGSGFFIRENGLILTNAHVVYGQRVIAVTPDDGRMVRAELVGMDPLIDLAVLSIRSTGASYPAVRTADAGKLQVGQPVAAIGNPFGLEQTLTVGIVSGINRLLDAAPLSMKLPLIQTDAAINPGNSGGPLLNMCGEVIGINSAVVGGAENIGFAVPINIALSAMRQILEHGRVIRPWLGVNGKLVDESLRDIVNIPLENGFLIETVEPDSPADKAGVRGGTFPVILAGMEFIFGGDIIVEANGKPLLDQDSYYQLIASLKIGQTVNLTLFHERTLREVTVRVEERPVLPGDFQWDLQPSGGWK